MADTAKMTDEQWREWTRTHQVCYNVQPLEEMHGGELVQVGFEVELAARLPSATEGIESRRRATRAVLNTLAELAERVFPAEGDIARSELAPVRAVAQLRRDTGRQPEVRRTVRIYRKQDSFRSVAEGDRQRLGPFERRLQELGAKRGAWQPPRY
jgi:hypothetical protein